MRLGTIFVISFALIGCAADQVKVDRAKEVVTAGNQVVSATSELFSQYRNTNSDYIKSFYTANVTCDITPGFVVHIRTGAPGSSVCLDRNEYDKYRAKALEERGEEKGNSYYYTVNLSYDKTLLVTTTSLVDGISKYMASLSAGMAGDTGVAEDLSSEAVANIGAVDSILKNLNDFKLLDTGDFKISSYKDSVSDFYSYIKGLHDIHQKSLSVNDYISSNANRIDKTMKTLNVDINKMMISMGLWKNGASINQISSLNKERRTTGKTDKDMLSSVLANNNMSTSNEKMAGSAVILAMKTFEQAQDDLNNLYSPNISPENKAKIRKEMFSRVIGGLKQAAAIAKILIAL